MQEIPNKIVIYYKHLLKNDLQCTVTSQMFSLKSLETIESNKLLNLIFWIIRKLQFF